MFLPKYTPALLYYSSGMTIIVTMWGADGFMVRILILLQEQRFTVKLQIWLCLVLYQQVSRGPRVGIIVLLSLVSFASFGRPIFISTPPIKFVHKKTWGCGVGAIVYKFNQEIMLVSLEYSIPVFSSLSTLVNIILTALIVLWLVYHWKCVWNALGAEHGSPYTNIITMCIKSSALTVIASGMYTILISLECGTSYIGRKFLLNLNPHICSV